MARVCSAEEQTTDHIMFGCPIHRMLSELCDLLYLDDNTIKWLRAPTPIFSPVCNGYNSAPEPTSERAPAPTEKSRDLWEASVRSCFMRREIPCLKWILFVIVFVFSSIVINGAQPVAN